MSKFIFNKEKYLERIKFQDTVTVSYESLKAIHRAQHLTIPFENFDICLGRSINLEPMDIVNKLIDRKRGGYCFELNGLLLMALNSFGFDARPLLSRVHVTGKPTGRGHQMTLVTIEEKKWIVDLGFGSNSPLLPIPLVFNKVISYENNSYRLIDSKLYGYMLQKKEIEEWKDLYSFDLSFIYDGDIEYGNHFSSTSKNSFFTNKRVAAIPVKNGIITLLDTKLKRMINGKEEMFEIEEGNAYLEMLNKEFGIEIDAKYDDLKPLNLELLNS
ncbi:N-hydroxyarylamine O-acetyltransferase [Tenacibaculum sp. 190524A02b]|uniref:arylamine N-acetyltransferase family protein n=1 Tax=Tenacibaculum vairaonense TaxID=3137860 RepID=UPI0032B2E3B1